MGLEILTAGESHGPAVIAVIDGLPSGLSASAEAIDYDLKRRQAGYGRGGRMDIESDSVTLLAGVRYGSTTGAPVALLLANRDHENWRDVMAVESLDSRAAPETRPRPGHGDLAGVLKYGLKDARDVLERASARETAARVAAGALCRGMLFELGMKVMSRVVAIGDVRAGELPQTPERFDTDDDPVRCADEKASRAMVAAIDRAREEGDSLGGVFEVTAFGLVPGLGSYSQANRRLDALLAAALMSIPGIKGVEIGGGFGLALKRGSETHDEIVVRDGVVARPTNRAGGIEAGVSNGEPVVARAAMKPIPTLQKPLATVDLETMEPGVAFKERADVCAVPAASVVGEAVVAQTIAGALLDKFGGDSMSELKRNLEGYLEQIAPYWKRA